MSGTIRTWSPPHSAVERLRLFALHGTEVLGEKIARSLGCHLAALEERSFEDGEHKSRPLDTVAGCDVYVVHSLHGGPQESPNDKLCRLLFFIGALKDAGAARVTAVMPYLCYARKDRRTKAQDPVTIRYLATLFEAAGVDTVVTLEVHNEAAFENAFRCPSVALSAAPLLIGNIREIAADRPICVVSPDLGGGKRAELLREASLASHMACSCPAPRALSRILRSTASSRPTACRRSGFLPDRCSPNSRSFRQHPCLQRRFAGYTTMRRSPICCCIRGDGTTDARAAWNPLLRSQDRSAQGVAIFPAYAGSGRSGAR